VFTTRNHEGSALGVRAIVVRDLFVPATTGTYTCELLAHAAAHQCNATKSLTVQGGDWTSASPAWRQSPSLVRSRLASISAPHLAFLC
jgi:hypothetical protein